MSFTERVREGLADLRKRDPKGRIVFGASSHLYRLCEPVVESDLCAFEATNEILLPAEYRTFLAELGSGGAGPYYSIFKLGEMDDADGLKPWTQGGLVGVLGRHFPHRDRWNLSESELERLYESDDDEEILRTYWIAVDGALPICHHGCALRDWLVVSGPEAGYVWHDATAEYGGWSPCARPDGRRMTFADWYLDWFDKAIAAAALGSA